MGEDSKASHLLERLSETRRALVTVESCTGGLIASRVTAVAGASLSYWGGMIVYDNTAKSALAGVPAELIARHGAVSAEVARALARGALERARAEAAASAPLGGRDWVSISTTGIAGPSGGSAEKPVGLCHIGVALSCGAKVSVMSHELRLSPGWTRAELQSEFTENAFELALDVLRD